MTEHEGKGAGGGAAGPARPRDRRATHRAAIEIPAVLRVGNRNLDCSIRDLSTKGIALSLKESVAPGMVVRVVFRLPNARQPVEVAGVLVRQVGGRMESTVGLEFIDPGADALRDIRTFVERNRSDLPFSRRERGPGKTGPDTARVVVGESGGSAASLRGLYRKAVDDVAEKGGERRGLLARWLRRGGS